MNVALCAPTMEGSYTSHWRLAHVGEQFGPRVWCSIVVDPLAPAPMMADGILVSPCVTPQVERIGGRVETETLRQLLDVHSSIKECMWMISPSAG